MPKPRSGVVTQPHPMIGSDDGTGALMVIGGAEDKLRRRTVLADFVQRAGGDRSRIAIVPSASSLGKEIVDVYTAVFERLGAGSTVVCDPETREESSDPELCARLDDVTGIFMTGGNQLKLSQIIAGTAFADALVAARARGVVIAGTSAGASIQSSHMVAFGRGGSTPKQRMTQVAAGLGLIESCVIDQHFEQRNRHGRLLMIVAQNPHLLGIGIDENTAAVITHEDGHEIMRVIGNGTVTVLDGERIVSNAHEAKRNSPMLASNVLLHVLPDGSTFDLTERRLVIEPRPDDPIEAATQAGILGDLRDMARDVAAGDVSPQVLRQRLTRRLTRGGSEGEHA